MKPFWLKLVRSQPNGRLANRGTNPREQPDSAKLTGSSVRPTRRSIDSLRTLIFTPKVQKIDFVPSRMLQ